MENTNIHIDTHADTYTDTEAYEAVSAIAEANPGDVRRDIDALLEIGEVDAETCWSGYLADTVADVLGDAYTEQAELFDCAIVAFFVDQMEGAFDEDEYDPEADPDLQEYYEARLACEEACSLYGADSEEYKLACLAFEEAERNAQVG